MELTCSVFVIGYSLAEAKEVFGEGLELERSFWGSCTNDRCGHMSHDPQVVGVEVTGPRGEAMVPEDRVGGEDTEIGVALGGGRVLVQLGSKRNAFCPGWEILDEAGTPIAAPAQIVAEKTEQGDWLLRLPGDKSPSIQVREEVRDLLDEYLEDLTIGRR